MIKAKIGYANNSTRVQDSIAIRVGRDLVGEGGDNGGKTRP